MAAPRDTGSWHAEADSQRLQNCEHCLLTSALCPTSEDDDEEAQLVLSVDCREAMPDEGVSVVGSHEVLGCWTPAKALRMTTSYETYPQWSVALSLLSGDLAESIAYKFLLQRLDRTGEVTWEALPENRSVTALAGAVVSARSTWGSLQETTITEVHSPRAGSKHQRAENHFSLAQDARLARLEKPLSTWLTPKEVLMRPLKVQAPLSGNVERYLLTPRAAEPCPSPTPTESTRSLADASPLQWTSSQSLCSECDDIMEYSARSHVSDFPVRETTVERCSPGCSSRSMPKERDDSGPAAVGASMVEVIFLVECSGTQPGERVFLVGGHERLGHWNPAKALPMVTTAQTFPQWCSAAVLLPAGMEAIEYKFIVQRDDRSGPVRWEECYPNHSIATSAGAVVTVRSFWGCSKSVTASQPCHALPVWGRVLPEQEEVSMAQISFFVECDRTQSGEAVFVVGSHPSIGSWSPEKALRLSTTAEAFPQWSVSAVFPLISQQEVIEYKFVVLREDRTGRARWEECRWNRRIMAVGSTLLTTTSDWSNMESNRISQSRLGPVKLSRAFALGEVAAIEDTAPLPEVLALALAHTDVPSTATTHVSRPGFCLAERTSDFSLNEVHRFCDASTAPVMEAIFMTECCDTKLGEAVFVVGSHEALGQWDRARGVRLFTTANTFPNWSSPPVLIPADQRDSVEYTFIVQHEDGSGPVRYEERQMTRFLQISERAVVAARSVWGNMPITTTMLSLQSGEKLIDNGGADSPTPARSEETIPQEIIRAPAAIESQPLAMQRKFSQSLLSLDDGDAAQGSSGEKVGEALEGPVAAACLSRGASFRDIHSFSALASPVDAQAKSEVRQRGGALSSSYAPSNLDVPVVIVTSELAPWSKTGGLGLVAASYACEFARNGHRTMAISPKYCNYEHLNYAGEAWVMVDGNAHLVTYWHRYMEVCDGKGCDFVFVEHPSLGRRGGLYSTDDGKEYADNLFRFTLLSLAALKAPLLLPLGGSPYGDKVLFLANDWQAGLVPLYLRYKYRRSGCYSQARVIYVVHNLGYQGQYHNVDAGRFFGVDGQAASDLAMGDCVNLSKAALICADRVLTVSHHHAWEIQTPEGGFGLDYFARKKAEAERLAGIPSGIDDIWDPETDTEIARRYSVKDLEEGKRANKAALQRSVGLQGDPSVVLIGFVGRLTWQKGVDLLEEVITWLMQNSGNGVMGRAQLIMMGHGDHDLATMLRWAEATYPGRVCGYVGYDACVEHQMMAGCDLLLMPSRYEPCGLPQMHAQRYGTLPVVTATGGLLDSVRDISEGVGIATGFHIPYPATDKIKETLYRAMELRSRRPAEFRRLQETAMGCDFCWARVMSEYERYIDQTLLDQPHAW